MWRRRLVVLVALAGPALALWARRRRGETGERVTLAYEDGSTVTLSAGSPDADRLLALARPLVGLRG